MSAGVHILRIPSHVVRERVDGERWCFYCRKRVDFILTVHAPDDPRSYYGPHSVISCENGHSDGDCFPDTYREWGDS